MSLILFPFSLELRGIETYPLDKIIDGVFVPLSDEVMLHLQVKLKLKNFNRVKKATFENVAIGPHDFKKGG